MTPPAITVRPMRPQEKPRVWAIMRRAFSVPVRLFFSWSQHILVAEQKDQLLGVVVLKMFPLPGGRNGGEVAWIFTDPDARGLGAGQALVERGLSYLECHGCDEILAVVEGNNSSSFKLFATRGFSILSPGEQYRRYGLRTFLVWVRALHVSDMGHFLWARPPERGADSPAVQWWGGALLNGLFAVPLALLDTALALFPFTGFNGRRLWDWSRPLWVLLSLIAVAVILV